MNSPQEHTLVNALPEEAQQKQNQEQNPTQAPAPSPGSSPATDRDARGRFAAGNRGGAGNPFARRTAALRKAIVNAVTEQDLAEVIQALLQKAKEGDVAAGKVLLSYTVGKPAAAENPDTLDRNEVEVLSSHFFGTEPLMRLAGLAPAESVLGFIHTMLPIMTEARSHQLYTMLKEIYEELGDREAEDKEDEAMAARYQEQVAARKAAADTAEPAGDDLHHLTEPLRRRDRERRAVTAALGLGKMKKSAGKKASKRARKAARAERRRREAAARFGRSPSPLGSNGHMPPSPLGSNGAANGAGRDR